MLRDSLDNLRARSAETLGPSIQRVGARIDPLIGQARGRYQKLEPRERLLVRIGAVVLGIFLLYNLIYVPIVDLSSGLEDKIAQRQHDLAQVRRLAGTYAQLKSDLVAAEHHTVPGKDFSLFSVVEDSLTRSVGRDKIGSIDT